MLLKGWKENMKGFVTSIWPHGDFCLCRKGLFGYKDRKPSTSMSLSGDLSYKGIGNFSKRPFKKEIILVKVKNIAGSLM